MLQRGEPHGQQVCAAFGDPRVARVFIGDGLPQPEMRSFVGNELEAFDAGSLFFREHPGAFVGEHDEAGQHAARAAREPGCRAGPTQHDGGLAARRSTKLLRVARQDVWNRLRKRSADPLGQLRIDEADHGGSFDGLQRPEKHVAVLVVGLRHRLPLATQPDRPRLITQACT